MALEREGTSEDMASKKTADMQSSSEVHSLVAYKLRVALAHVRKLFDTCTDFEGHPLAPMFAILRRPKDDDVQSKRRRLDQRMGSRVHPFPSFRKPNQESDDDDAAQEEDPKYVTRYFDLSKKVARSAQCHVNIFCRSQLKCEMWSHATTCHGVLRIRMQVGIMLLSDGTELLCDEYKSGPEGFVVGEWHYPLKMSLATEMPNRFLVGGVIQQEPVFKRPSSAMKKKPAAPSPPEDHGDDAVAESGDEGGDDHDDGNDDDANDDDGKETAAPSTPKSFKLEYRTVPGHDGDYTVVARRADVSSDKAHNLQVSGRMHKGWSAREVCDQVVSRLQHKRRTKFVGTD